MPNKGFHWRTLLALVAGLVVLDLGTIVSLSGISAAEGPNPDWGRSGSSSLVCEYGYGVGATAVNLERCCLTNLGSAGDVTLMVKVEDTIYARKVFWMDEGEMVSFSARLPYDAARSMCPSGLNPFPKHESWEARQAVPEDTNEGEVSVIRITSPSSTPTAAEAPDPQFTSGHSIHEEYSYTPYGVTTSSTFSINYLENRGAAGMVTAWVERVQGQPEAQRVFWMETGERVGLEAVYSFPVPGGYTQVRFNVRTARPDDRDITSDRVMFNVIRLPGFPAYPAPVPTATPLPTATPWPTATPNPVYRPISSGQTVSSSIDPMGWPAEDTDGWTFSGNQDDLVNIRVQRAPGSGLEPGIDLSDPYGNWEQSARSQRGQGYAVIANWPLRQSGTYIIKVEGLWSTTGAYTLSLVVTPSGAAPAATPVPSPARTPIPMPMPTITPTATLPAMLTPTFTPAAAPSAGLAIVNQLASARQRLILVLTWDASDPNDPWKLYDPHAPEWANDLSAMERGHGYWINVDATSTLSYGGRSYPLAPGWNLVGWQG